MTTRPYPDRDEVDRVVKGMLKNMHHHPINITNDPIVWESWMPYFRRWATSGITCELLDYAISVFWEGHWTGDDIATNDPLIAPQEDPLHLPGLPQRIDDFLLAIKKVEAAHCVRFAPL